MKNIVGVSFDNNDKITYFFTNDLELKKNLTVIVEKENNQKFGKIITEAHPIDSKNLNEKLGNIVRIATKDDYFKHQQNLKKAELALNKCKELVKKYNLDMRIVDANYTFNQDQLVFHFYADERIDFRDLARDLASIYKTRIELRQIGVRDKAKKVCGIGTCGQKLCCSRFLDEFESVSISMAKNQNLSLNPNKINGVCGRLLCCLKYEDDCYKKCRKNLPSIGQTAQTKEGTGNVVSVDVLAQKFKVNIPSKGIIEVKVDGSN